MRHYQEYKIESTWPDGRVSECFFFDHDLYSARHHALKYVERNKTKLHMKLYRINENAGPRWALVGTY